MAVPSPRGKLAALAGAAVAALALAAVAIAGLSDGGAAGRLFPGLGTGFLRSVNPATFIAAMAVAWPAATAWALHRGDRLSAWSAAILAALHASFDANQGVPRASAALTLLVAAAGHVEIRARRGARWTSSRSQGGLPPLRQVGWGTWVAAAGALVALLLAGADFWFHAAPSGGPSESLMFWAVIDALFVFWPASMAAALWSRRPRLAWIAWMAYLAQSAQFGLSAGGLHFTFGVTTGLAALLVDSIERRRQAPAFPSGLPGS